MHWHKNYLLEDEKRKTKISNRSYKKPNLKIAKFNANSKSSINIFSNNSSRMTKGKKIKIMIQRIKIILKKESINQKMARKKDSTKMFLIILKK